MKLRYAPLLLIAPLLAACGHSGSLDRPPPMFGKNKAKYQAEIDRDKAEKDAAKKAAKANGTLPAPPPPFAPIDTGPLAPPPAP